MMKKTTSALAIAALLGSGAASAATFQIDDNTSFEIAAGVYWTFTEATEVNDSGERFDTSKWEDNASDIVFSAERTANGLTTFINIDFDGFGNPDAGSSDALVVDEMSLGLEGDFGKVAIGSDSDSFEAADVVDIENGQYGLTIPGGSNDNIIKYDSPDLGPLSFAVNASTYNDEDDRTGTTLGGSLVYDLGAATLKASYNDRGGEAENKGGDEAFYGVALEFAVADVDLGVSYITDTNPAAEGDALGVSASYNYGAGSIYAAAQNLNFDSVADAQAAFDDDSAETDDSFTEILAGVTYTVSDNMDVFFEVLRTGREDGAGDATGVGVNAYF